MNNVIAERQFNVSQLYLHDNLSELSKQASITFVENILHSGKSNGRTTAAAKDIHERRMRAYGQLLNTELLQEARKNLEKIQKGNVDSGPLTAKDVYTKAWEEKKPNKQMSTIIKSFKDERRKLELLWKASTKGTIYLEEQRSFRPTALQGLAYQ